MGAFSQALGIARTAFDTLQEKFQAELEALQAVESNLQVAIDAANGEIPQLSGQQQADLIADRDHLIAEQDIVLVQIDDLQGKIDAMQARIDAIDAMIMRWP